jgi:hypothetical protein
MRSGIAITLAAAALMAYGVYWLSRPRPAASALPPLSVTAAPDHGAFESPAPASVLSAKGPALKTAFVEKNAHGVTAAAKPPLPPLGREAFARLWTYAANGSARRLSTRAEHDRFQGEPIDPNWSPNVEANLSAYLQGLPSAPLTDIVGAECHAGTCEILTAGKTPDGAGLVEWQNDIYQAPRQSWWSGYGLKDISFAVTQADDGRWIGVTYLTSSRIKVPTS